MPGTIQVSVLGLIDVETSSPVSSNASIKVAMGKLEYRTSDSGDYIFPVTRLRENLIVTLLDVNGNGILHKEIETRMIIESGLLEEKLSFNGYGYIQLKMQFVLSEEDRNRIRFLRQSALRKKHEKLINHNFSTNSIASDKESVSSNRIMWKPEVKETKFKVSKKLSEAKKPVPESVSIVKQEDKDLSNPEQKSMRRSMSESNVRKMISTFEINVTQDTKIRTTKIQAGSCKVAEEKTKEKSQLKLEKPEERKISSVNMKKLVCRENTERCKDLVKEEKSLEQSTRRSDSLSKQRRKRSSVIEVRVDEKKPNKSVRLKDSQLENARGSRLWIFPDETDSKTRYLDLLQKKTQESTRERVFCHKNIAKMNSNNNKWKNIERPKKHKPENSADSRGPVGQVMRALIVVGFATLVFLTRQ